MDRDKLSTALVVSAVVVIAVGGLMVYLFPHVTATVPVGTMRRVSSTCDHDTCLDVWKDEGAGVCFLVVVARSGPAVTPMACPQ